MEYNELSAFFHIKPIGEKYDGYKFAFTRENPNTLYQYNPSKFGEWASWYIERCDSNMIIFSLKEHVLTSESKFRYHITVHPSAWNKIGEFHVTVDQIEKKQNRIRCHVVCTTFYSFNFDKTLTYKEAALDVKRPSCSLSKVFKKEADDLASKFCKLIHNLLLAKKMKSPVKTVTKKVNSPVKTVTKKVNSPIKMVTKKVNSPIKSPPAKKMKREDIVFKL